jgi:hypothetical protein
MSGRDCGLGEWSIVWGEWQYALTLFLDAFGEIPSSAVRIWPQDERHCSGSSDDLVIYLNIQGTGSTVVELHIPGGMGGALVDKE